MKPSDFTYQYCYLLLAAAFPPQNEASLHCFILAATRMYPKTLLSASAHFSCTDYTCFEILLINITGLVSPEGTAIRYPSVEGKNSNFSLPLESFMQNCQPSIERQNVKEISHRLIQGF